jgi:hypothetical protein
VWDGFRDGIYRRCAECTHLIACEIFIINILEDLSAQERVIIDKI